MVRASGTFVGVCVSLFSVATKCPRGCEPREQEATFPAVVARIGSEGPLEPGDSLIVATEEQQRVAKIVVAAEVLPIARIHPDRLLKDGNCLSGPAGPKQAQARPINRT